MLADESLDLVLLDELTYMVAYDYLPLEEVLTALRNRPAHQTVIITGRGCHREITELADTVSELRPVKHAFDAGIKAQMGIDYCHRTGFSGRHRQFTPDCAADGIIATSTNVGDADRNECVLLVLSRCDVGTAVADIINRYRYYGCWNDGYYCSPDCGA
jgi:hypothetical protein